MCNHSSYINFSNFGFWEKSKTRSLIKLDNYGHKNLRQSVLLSDTSLQQHPVTSLTLQDGPPPLTPCQPAAHGARTHTNTQMHTPTYMKQATAHTYTHTHSHTHINQMLGPPLRCPSMHPGYLALVPLATAATSGPDWRFHCRIARTHTHTHTHTHTPSHTQIQSHKVGTQTILASFVAGSEDSSFEMMDGGANQGRSQRGSQGCHCTSWHLIDHLHQSQRLKGSWLVSIMDGLLNR